MKKIFVSALVLFVSLNSLAAITVVTDKAAFTAAIVDSVTDAYADMACGDVTLSPVARTVAPYSYQVSSQFDLFNLCIAPGTSLSPNDALSPLVLDTMTGDASAIGADFFTTDFGGAVVAGSVTLTVTDSTGAVHTHTVTAPDTFAGFTSDGTIVSVSALAAPHTDGHWATINSLILGKSH